MSHDAPTVSARFFYGSTTTHDGSATIHPDGDTNAHDESMIRFGTSIIQAGSATTPSSYCIRDESGWIGMYRVSVIPRFTRTPTNDHEYTYGAFKNEPDSATVELRLRPRPQSTKIRPECFKRFKIVVALWWRFPNRKDSSRITKVLLRFTPMSIRCYYDSCRCITI